MERCAREVESCELAAGDDGDELGHVPLIWRWESAGKCKGKLSMMTEERLSCVHGVVAAKEEEERRFPQVGPGDSHQESGGNSSTALDFTNNMKYEIPYDTWSDELDHIPLVTRRKMPLLRKHLQHTASSHTYPTEDSGRSEECSHGIVKEQALLPSLGVSGVALVNDVIGEEKNKSVLICSASGGNSSLAMERPDFDIHGNSFLFSLVSKFRRRFLVVWSPRGFSIS